MEWRDDGGRVVEFPKVITDVLPQKTFFELNNHLSNEGWLRSNADYDPNTGLSWTVFDENNLIYYDIGSRLSLSIRKFLKTEISLVKIHINGQTMGQLSTFHKDSLWESVWTCVLFTNVNWDVNHGGEFTLFDPNDRIYKSVSCIPNSCALFPASWEHKGACPLIPAAGMRMSIAFTYCLTSDFDQYIEEHTELRKFVRT